MRDSGIDVLHPENALDIEYDEKYYREVERVNRKTIKTKQKVNKK